MTSVGRNLVADLDCKRLDMDQQMWPSAEQQLSAPSSSRSSLPKEYEVFLSFRGPDVREHFADFLHTHLVRFGIRTFLDDEDLPKGEDIEASLLKDIQNSKVYIPVLSPDYASSKWCLKELALMVKCCKQSNGHLLLPIFYMVEPRDARQQGNSYEEAFQQHSKIYDAETVMEWRKALKEVGKLKGWHVTKSVRQGIVVDQVLSNVSSHLDRDYMLRTDKLFGIEGHIENLKKLLHSDDECVKIIGIHGMGGLGKTTIAKELYNHVHKQFDRYCFVQDVRETLLKTNGIVKLQKIILSRIMCSDVKVLDANRGINMIKSRICTYKVLIILDDVDNRLEFDKIFGELEEFRLGSRFVITTRDRKVVEFFPHYELYEPKLMGEEFSLQLFSRHAFRENHPPQEYVALSKEFVKIAAGLPLAVKVIGSLLFREDERFWKAKLMQLEDIPILEVQEILRISYEGLTPEVQHVFCDIACHFVGEQNDQHFYMWSDCGFHPEIAITILVQRSLLKVNESNSFWMHDHIRDLGRTIVRQENVQFPWKRSRIWCNKDALDMLTHKEGSAELQTLEVNILEAEYFELEDTRFEKLSGLRYLKVTGGGLVGNFIKVLPKLCWLQLFSCSSFPTDLDMENLVILQMEYCSVTDDWRGWERIKEAHKLKSMSLRHCHMLRKVPDLSRSTNDPIGIVCDVENVKKRLQSDYECVKFIGIHGMGGLGKTTIAKVFYNDQEVREQFDRCCFLEDVRETLLKTNGIVTLQKKVISSILRLDVKVLDANEGISTIKNRICKYKVLIILDDVDNRLEFDKIFGELTEFRLGSRFVITTRDTKVVEFFPHNELHEHKLMGEDFSLQLFSRHAFRENHPPQEDVALSMEFVKIAAGLPLALKVIGSLLFRENKSFWKAKLKQLEDIPISEVQEILRISYEGLTPEAQHVFLDIACHFVGEQNDQHFYMWSDCGFHPEIAITILVQRSLLKVNLNCERNLYETGEEQESNAFWMHDHIRDLGRTIVRQENVQCPWKRSRIWCNKDALDMLTHKEVII
ncbi:Disease resistance protein L6 [Linum perenne]